MTDDSDDLDISDVECDFIDLGVSVELVLGVALVTIVVIGAVKWWPMSRIVAWRLPDMQMDGALARKTTV